MGEKTERFVTAEEAVRLVNSGDRVYIHGGAATPLPLVDALLDRAGELRDVELMAISTYGMIDWDRPAVRENFRLNSLFVSANVRDWVSTEGGDYVPVFLSEIPQLFREGYLPPDVALMHVSPPDRHGFCTLGTSVDASLRAMEAARKVIALVNPLMPRVLGDGIVHSSRFDALVWSEVALPEVSYASLRTAETDAIGARVAELIDDGATLQMGIGAIPDAVLQYLGNHRDLGVHTEMFSDGIIPLIRSGAVTNAKKKVVPGKTVSAFVLGTKTVYDFIDDNPSIACMHVDFVNDTRVIRKNPAVVAINSAIEIDLTGQVCADSIGTFQYSGIGGQMDFIRGAALSEWGKPIIAMPSVTKKGVSRIVPLLKPGAGVVTTRGHIHYVVTEWGTVNLFGKSLEQRARLLTSIAHPNHREALERAAWERFRGHR